MLNSFCFCSMCQVKKPHTLEYFYQNKKQKNGIGTQCRECTKAKAREWVASNKTRKKETDKTYARKNSEKIREYLSDYRSKNLERASEYAALYADKNREDILSKKRAYFQRPEIKKRQAEYQRNRRRSDPKFRLVSAIRSAVSGMVSGKLGATRHLPYNADDLCSHIEKQFSKGMTWENYGKWHVDHIMPCAAFEMSGKPNCPEFQACWSLSNLRPMWASENMSKQDKRTHLI